MTIRPPSGIPLPELVLVANRVLAEEAEALRTALEDSRTRPIPPARATRPQKIKGISIFVDCWYSG